MKKMLDLSKVPLSGRSAQLGIMQDAFDSLTSDHHDQSTVLSASGIAIPATILYIEAPSGAGKSFLVETWHQRQDAVCSTLFVSGKFDQNHQSTQPYSAIIQVLNELCYAVDTEALKRQISIDSSEKLEVLIDLIPYLQDITTSKSFATRSKAVDNDSISTTTLRKFGNFLEETKISQCELNKQSTRFNEAIQTLLRLISIALNAPFVMLIDDIQWADKNSLEVLQALLVSSDLGRILIVLASRPVKEDWLFFTQTDSLLKALGRPLINIRLESLTVLQVNDVASTIMEQNPTSTLHLAEIVHEKTKGNPFFVMQYMSLLERHELLCYSMKEYCWCWDEQEIQNQTDFTDNVAAVVLDHIQAMDEDTQRILQHASHLGSTFPLHDLAFLVRGLEVVKDVLPLDQKVIIDGVEQQYDNIEAILQKAVAANLIDDQGGKRFKFSHDSVQKLFLESASIDSKLLYRIGSIIRCMHKSEHGKDWMRFAAVQVLNDVMVCVTDAASRHILVHMNLRAAHHAISTAAFFPASNYLFYAVKCANLFCNPWQGHYELMILLYTKAITVGCVCGQHQLVESLSGVIFEKAVDFKDEVEAHVSLAVSLQAQSKVEEGFRVLLAALRRLGESFPRKPGRSSIAKSARETQKLLLEKTDSDIVSMTVISDIPSRNTMQLLSMAFLNAYQRHNTDWMLLIMRRLICKTLQLGLSKHAPFTFAIYAEQLAKEGHFDEAFRFGRLAKFVIAKMHVKENLAVTTYFLAVYVEHLKIPMYQSVRTLDRAFKVGMELGDSRGAFLCAAASLSFKVLIGSKLGSLKYEATTLCHQANAYTQDDIVPKFLLVRQYAAALQGKTLDPLILDGVAMTEKEIANRVRSSTGVGTKLYSGFLEMLQCVYMGDWDKAGVPLDMMDGIFKANPRILTATKYDVPLLYTFAGVIWYKRYAKSKNRSVLRKAKFAMKQLRLWAGKGALNVVTGLWFVEAQQQVADGTDIDTVKTLFDKTIAGLHRSGLRSLEALAWESFAQYAIAKGREVWAIYYLQQARALYNEFGALAKIRQLDRDQGTQIVKMPSLTSLPFRTFKQRQARRYSSLLGDSDDRPSRISSLWDSSSGETLTTSPGSSIVKENR